MLHAEGNADNGDAKEESEKQVGQGDPYTAAENPKDVHQRRKTTARPLRLMKFHPKGSDCYKCELKALKSERDADDRNAEDQSPDEIFEENQKSAKDNPDNIADEFHD
jgi:hypothetical protein